MLVEKFLAYVKAKEESQKQEVAPTFCSADCSLEERKKILVELRKKEFREAEANYGNRADADWYLDALWERVVAAEQIVDNIDLQHELLKKNVNPPRQENPT